MSINENAGASIESRKDYKNDPKGQFDYWQAEIQAAQKLLKPWHKKGDKIVSRYIDSKRSQGADNDVGAGTDRMFKLNMFYSNVTTLYSMLYGNIPTVDVSRRYADSNDDVGRVAAETMERLLNMDIAEHGQDYDVVLRSTLLDRLTAGLGAGRVRYEVETEGEGDAEQMVSESAPIDYYYWQDVLWPWSRNWSELRWIGFRSFLTKDEIAERFGDKVAEKIDLKQQNSKEADGQSSNDDKTTAWTKAEIWEIWDKESRQVIWFNHSIKRILDTQKDPLGLNDFFPTPPFFLANPTSTLYLPTPDYTLCQDMYNEIDLLQTRIAILTEAVKAVGVYDSSADGIKRMFKEGVENELIPVDNWALFAEKGGIQGQVVWVPIADIVNALDKLRQLRDEQIGLLQQISGMADVMRGGMDNQYEGVGQTQMKAKFGSIRIQALQDEFASFASALLALKGEVIARHFNPETIAAQSNMQHSMDKDLLPDAIKLIKNPDQAKLRIAIRPESVAMVDYAQLKAERTDYINALSMFLQSASPLLQQEPATAPFLLQLLKWGLAGFKGSQEIEGVMDKAVEAATEAAKNPKPDPAAEQQKAQQEAEAQKEQMKLQGELQKIQMKAQSDMQVREQDKQADIETAQVQHQLDMEKISAEGQAALMQIEVKSKADIETEMAQAQANIAQSEAGSMAEVQKEATKTELEMEKAVHSASLDMDKNAQKAVVDAAKDKQNADLSD